MTSQIEQAYEEAKKSVEYYQIAVRMDQERLESAVSLLQQLEELLPPKQFEVEFHESLD